MAAASTTAVRRGVFFDVDGTLASSAKLCFEATVAVLVKNGHAAVTEEEFHAGCRYTTPSRFAWHVTGNTDDPCGEELGRQFDDMYVDMVTIDTAPFFPGIKTMLADVAAAHPAVRFGALSNACGAYVQNVVKCNDVVDSFPVRLGADDVPKAKPNPDGLLACCAALDLGPEACCYVGDAPTDGQAAAAAGMPSIGVTWGSYSAGKVHDNFDVAVDTVEQLRAAIEDVLARA